ncbi:SpoIID/LytB domain-containing protein [Nocardia sp. NPDC046473]|uniref:SpoIID/LytB domain-containing protein n=1 Tax=Nocardia sp. NPDC046473 TaxID=3155733 RepID=UPI003406930A
MRSVLVTGGATLTAGAVLVLWVWPGETPYLTAAGPGHGRGMSQLGAFASAQEGQTAENILAHYYPGATLGTVPANTVGIRLTAQDDSTLDTFAPAGLRVAGQLVEAGQAAHLTPLPNGGANVVVTVGCDGDVLWQAATDDPWVYPIDPGPNRPAAEHLTLCGGSAYRGALGVATENGAARTVNRVDVEDYLLGVIPAEVQANWADKGGAEALRAQAIAARSYVLAEHRYSYAQSCDTTDCQAYPGTVKEDPRSAAAVVGTAGIVLLRDGRILRSEYSSAPGGGEPADIYTFDVGPALSDLAPNAPTAPVDPRTKVAVGESPIDVEYRRIGGAASKVGQPLGPEMALPEHAGTYRMFTNGVIISTATLGAQVVDFTTLLQLVPDPQTPKGGPSKASVPSAPSGAVVPEQVPSAAGVRPVPSGASASPAPASAPPVADGSPMARSDPSSASMPSGLSGAVVPEQVPSDRSVPPAPSGAATPPVPESVPSGASMPLPESTPSGVKAMPEPPPSAADTPPVPASPTDVVPMRSDASGAPVSERVPTGASVALVPESAPHAASQVSESVPPGASVLPVSEAAQSSKGVPSAAGLTFFGAGAPPVLESVPGTGVPPVSESVEPIADTSWVAEVAPSGAGLPPVHEPAPSTVGAPQVSAPVLSDVGVASVRESISPRVSMSPVHDSAWSGVGGVPVSESIPSAVSVSSVTESALFGATAVPVFDPVPAEADVPSGLESEPPSAGVPSLPESVPSGVSPVPMPESVPSGVRVPPVFESAPPVGSVPPANSVTPGSTIAPTTAATPTPRPTPGIPIPSGGATSSPLAPGSSGPAGARR